jgi:amino acid adenylation domain-containing protein
VKQVEALLAELKQHDISLWTENQTLRYRAPKGGLSTAFKERIATHKADLIRFLNEQQNNTETDNSAEVLPQITPDPESAFEPFPLSAIQQAYWLGRQPHLDLGNVATQVYQEWSVADLDIKQLNMAWQKVMARHSILRTIITDDGQQQVLADMPDYQLPVRELPDLDSEAATDVLTTIRNEINGRIHQTGDWPLFDARITKLKDTNHLHFCMDMLIVDSWSIERIVKDWQTFYLDLDAQLPPLELTFRDYRVMEKHYEETSNVYQKAKKYWMERLDTLASAPKLPLAKELNEIETPQFTWTEKRLSAPLWEALKNKAAKHHLQPSALLVAVYAEALGRWSKTPHLTLNQTFFHRLPFHPQVNEVAGEFTSTLLVEIDNREAASFIERVKQVQKRAWKDLDQRYFSGVDVLREFNRRRKSAELMPVVFTNLLGVQAASNNVWGERVHQLAQTSQVYLDHIVREIDGELSLNWSAIEELFPAGLLEDMFTSQYQLLERLATDDTAWTELYPLQLPEKQKLQQQQVNATQTSEPEILMHELFLQQMQLTPNNIAVISGKKTLTYQQLYQQANQVAHWLRDQGAEPNQLVAVVIEKGWQQVVAVMGVLMSGSAYLPIDPQLPSERQAYLLEQAKVRCVLTQQKWQATLNWPTAQCLIIDTLDASLSLPALNSIQSLTDLAYVIYTSGSTGNPKGVMIDHRGAVNTILDINRRFNVTAKDRILALSALNFDLSVYDIFGLLAVGGSVVMPSPDGRRDPSHWESLLQEHKVTLWNTVPALMQMLVEYQSGQEQKSTTHTAALRLVLMSGDWIPLNLPDRIQAHYPNAEIISLGGATEASIWSICFPVTHVDPSWTSIPYGKPMDNQTFHVLNEQLEPCPTWLPGQLYIGGIGVALGYWQDKEKTDASFFTHPRTGERLYKTGDLGRYLPDGNIEFLGREDFQVKIGGHRIELGEIETHLMEHDAVQKAIVSAVGETHYDKQLVAYIIPNDIEEDAEEKQLANKTIDDEAIQTLDPDAVLTDPVARLQFKLKQRGLRSPAPSLSEVALPEAKLTKDDYLQRQSFRQFSQTAIDIQQLGQFLSCLTPYAFEETVLPKYRYPSSGSLYPIQSYLYIKPERISGIAGGFYYYHPQKHSLQLLSTDSMTEQELYGGGNQIVFAQSAFSLFLVAEYNAIKPLYGDYARDLCLVEAGYISQLLMSEVTKQSLGLCPIGGLYFDPLREKFDLGDSHELLHSFLGGAISAEQTQQLEQVSNITSSTAPDSDIDEDNTEQSLSERLKSHLREKLPHYMVPNLYVELAEFPLTANAKIDRNALPRPDLVQQSTEFVKPSSELERKLAKLVQKLFKLKAVGLHDDFFNLGADSLDMVQLYNEAQTAFQREIKMADIFNHTTVHKLAAFLDKAPIKETVESPPSNVIPDSDLNPEQIDQLSVNLDNLTEAEIELLLKQLDTQS